ncbi:MAG: helix-turn-helix transcriptional regulator [Candidatus Nomurabacteria bacterium]|nr:MAG: helix-turn-helix transcriptional regulator [Candidatus Nomurabacteria bacterium]
MEKVLNKVAEYRQKNEETQEELAAAVGVTRQTVIAIERGNYTPSVRLALKIAQHYSKKTDDIFSLDE